MKKNLLHNLVGVLTAGLCCFTVYTRVMAAEPAMNMPEVSLPDGASSGGVTNKADDISNIDPEWPAMVEGEMGSLDRYDISTLGNLVWINNKFKETPDFEASFKLLNDLVIPGVWHSNIVLRGLASFNGGGHTITFTSRDEHTPSQTVSQTGFFAKIEGGSVYDLNLFVDIEADSTYNNVGALANEVVVSIEHGIYLSNISVSGSLKSTFEQKYYGGSVQNAANVGGLVGKVSRQTGLSDANVSIRQCSVNAEISSGLNAGGLIGQLLDLSVSMQESSVLGTIGFVPCSEKPICSVGGFVGEAMLHKGIDITNSYSRASLKLDNSGEIRWGTLVGSTVQGGNISAKHSYVYANPVFLIGTGYATEYPVIGNLTATTNPNYSLTEFYQNKPWSDAKGLKKYEDNDAFIGILAYNLSESLGEGKSPWGQNLKEGEPYPLLYGLGNSYAVYKHGVVNPAYNNVAGHDYDANGICKGGGEAYDCYEPAEEILTEGKVMGYKIKNWGNLAWINQMYATTSGMSVSNILVENDITIPGQWHSNIVLKFGEVFDGGGHIISFTSYDEHKSGYKTIEHTGLFKSIAGGTVKNLTLDVDIKADSVTNYVGAVANEVVIPQNSPGYFASLENISVRGTLTSTFEPKYSSPIDPFGSEVRQNESVIGGLVGRAATNLMSTGETRHLYIKNCNVDASLNTTMDAGGLIGQLTSLPIEISNTSVAGNFIVDPIETNRICHIGGLAGYISSVNEAKIASFYSSANLKGNKGHFGTLIGDSYDVTLEVTNSYVFVDKEKLTAETYPVINYDDTKAKTFRNFYQNADCTQKGVEVLNDEDFANGSLAYRLAQIDAKSFWGQDLSVAGSLPQLYANADNCKTVYRHGLMSPFYSNESAHAYDEDGFCGGKNHDCYEKPESEQGADNSITYHIKNLGNLYHLNVPDDLEVPVTYELECDLELEKWRSELGIRKDVTFNGNGHTISIRDKKLMGFDDDEVDYFLPTGLFNVLGGVSTVRDLNINVDIDEIAGDSEGSWGAVANRIDYEATVNLKNVTVNGRVKIDGEANALGGAVGKVSNSATLVMNGIINNASITATRIAGGLVGEVESSAYLEMKQCVNHGNVAVASAEVWDLANIGGLAGRLDEACEASLFRVYNTGSFSLDSKYESIEETYTGGFIGFSPMMGSSTLSLQNAFCFIPDPLKQDKQLSAVGNLHQYGDELIDTISIYHVYQNVPATVQLLGKYKQMSNDEFASGLVANELNVSDSMYWFQNIGEDAYPSFRFERLEQTHDTVFVTCNEAIFTNTEYVQFGLDGNVTHHHFIDGHLFCEFCDAVNPDFHGQIEIADTTQLNSIVDDLVKVVEAGVEVNVVITDTISYDLVDYSKLTNEELEEQLPEKASIGTEEKPFVGVFDGEGGVIANYAFNQSGFFGTFGQTLVDEVTEILADTARNITINNAVIFNDLENVVKTDEGVPCAAVYANVNNGVLEYLTFVGQIATNNPEAINCLVGTNNGQLNFSFAYFTDLETVQEHTGGNKAAYISKSGVGVGRPSTGSTNKVASNSTQSYSVPDDEDVPGLGGLSGESYYPASESELAKAERIFSNEEFASGVVAYWLNFDGEGYTGNYTRKYSQGVLTPELSVISGVSVHRIVYQGAVSNKDGSLIDDEDVPLIVAKAYANEGEKVNIIFAKPVESVKIGDSEAEISADKLSAVICVPFTEEADVVVDIVFEKEDSTGTDAEMVLNVKAQVKVLAEQGKLTVYGANNQELELYAINGSLLKKETVKANKVVIPDLPNGIYLVKVAGQAMKVILK